MLFYQKFIINFLKSSIGYKFKYNEKKESNFNKSYLINDYFFLLRFKRNILDAYKYIFNIHLNTTFNNNFLSITDYNGKIIKRTMPGIWHFKGAERKTTIALKLLAEILCYELKTKWKIYNINILRKGVDPYNKYMILLKLLIKLNLNIYSIKDLSQIAHNGTRPKKKWRLKNKKRRILIFY